MVSNPPFKIKVALSSLQLSIIELVFVALDKGCLRWGIPPGGYSHFLWIHRQGPSFYPKTPQNTEIY